MNNKLDKLIAVGSAAKHPSIHFVDIENLCGCGKVTISQVIHARLKYEKAVQPASGDVICIASGPQNRKAIYEGWGKAVYLWRKGPDGADNALLETFLRLDNLGKYSHLILASGDGGLSPIASKAEALGVPVTVVVRDQRGCSSKFRTFSVVSLERVGA